MAVAKSTVTVVPLVGVRVTVKFAVVVPLSPSEEEAEDDPAEPAPFFA